mmetsp:Transcript_32229/g.41423  ORF Transcript_32229/g.41423 Transcript_32229/m.41423 type:complete len:361 (+) Transcript_32229:271-1353(+)
MEPLVSIDIPEKKIEEEERNELNSPLPNLPSSITEDIENGIDPDTALRNALEKSSSDVSISSAAAIETTTPPTVESVIISEPKDYFAMGNEQPIQCMANCHGNTYEDRRMKRDHIVPCYSNAPLKYCRGGNCPRTFHCLGNRFRVCSRAGNFTVLLERLIPQSGYQSINNDASEGDDDVLRPHIPPKRELWLVLGPYWPFCLSLTTSLMVFIPMMVIIICWHIIPFKEVIYAFIALTLLSLLALASVACRNPGLIPHYHDEPEESMSSPVGVRPNRKWIFNDMTSSWRPRGAVYDRDVNAIIAEFDHVCPFTGTAIGGNNIYCFYWFVGMIQILICIAVIIGAWGLFLLSANGMDWNPND